MVEGMLLPTDSPAWTWCMGLSAAEGSRSGGGTGVCRLLAPILLLAGPAFAGEYGRSGRLMVRWGTDQEHPVDLAGDDGRSGRLQGVNDTWG